MNAVSHHPREPSVEAVERDMAALAAALDGVGVALCVFDADDQAMLWNRSFLMAFPEHDGHIHAGESYVAQQRRSEAAPVFTVRSGYRGRHLAASTPLADGRLIRVWAAAPARTDLFDDRPDGVMALGTDDRIIAVNDAFLALYDLTSPEQAIGRAFPEIVRAAWLHGPDAEAVPDRVAALLYDPRAAGETFEVELPGNRWRQLTGRQLANGTAYVSHVDISAQQQQRRELAAVYAKLDALAVTDGLTGLANRRRFEDALDEEARRAARSGAPLSLMLIDIDEFKQVNEREGHAAGDAMLRSVGSLIERRIRRPGDLAARYGGNEFAVILPGNDTEGSVLLGEALLTLIAAHDAPGFAGAATVSIGVACVVVGEGGRADPAALFAAADRALHAAKSDGRNQVVAAPEVYRLREMPDHRPPLIVGLSVPS